MVFGIIAMILVGASWIVGGFVAGTASRRNLNMGLILSVGAVLAILLTPLIVGGFYWLDKCGIALHHEIYPILVPLKKDSLTVMLLVVLGGCFNFTQLQFMSQAMKNGPNGIVWSIVQSGFIVPFALGIICFGEKMSWIFAISLIMVIAALVLFALASDNQARGNWLMLAMAAFVSTCICQSFQYIPSNLPAAAEVSSVWRTFCYFLGLLIAFGVFCCVSKPMRRDTAALIKNKYIWRYACLYDAVSILFCACLLYPGMDALADSRVGAIATQLMTSSGIVAFEIYALTVLKEKRKPLQVLALMLCLASVVLVCFI